MGESNWEQTFSLMAAMDKSLAELKRLTDDVNLPDSMLEAEIAVWEKHLEWRDLSGKAARAYSELEALRDNLAHIRLEQLKAQRESELKAAVEAKVAQDSNKPTQDPSSSGQSSETRR